MDTFMIFLSIYNTIDVSAITDVQKYLTDVQKYLMIKHDANISTC